MNTTQAKTESAKVRKVEIELPEGLYNLLEKVCEIQGMSVNDYLIHGVVVILDGDLDMHLSDLPDLGLLDGDQRAYVESLAWPESLAQGARV